MPMPLIPPDCHEPPLDATAIRTSRLHSGRAILLPVKRKLAFILVLAAWLISSPHTGALGGETQLSEYQVKAAYLYNFAKFIEWPPGTAGRQNTFTICVLGKNPFGNALENIAGKLVRNQKVVVRHINNIDEIKECEMLFISAAERDNITSIIAALSSVRGVLTISDAKRFVQAGGMIGFVLRLTTRLPGRLTC
jgi:hypothetical protein